MKQLIFKNYYEVRDWLEGFIPLVYGKEELGLARIENLLRLLGNPEKKFKSIHVAGTSGKGSTAYYVARLLEVSHVSKVSKVSKASKNLKIGLHLSPHLVDIRERMQLFEKPATRNQLPETNLMPMGRFLRLFGEVRPVVEKIQKTKSELTPSYFEILVAASFKHFAEEKVDWAVVEVGLGGRLDATNVLMPKVSVITNIGLDHTEILGDTIEKIAYEKAGIIKTKVSQVSNVSQLSQVGIPVVTGATGEALRVIEEVAREKGSKVIRVKASKGQSARDLNLLLAEKAVEVVLLLRGPRSAHMNVGRGNLGKRDSFDSLRMTEEEVKGFGLGLPGRFEEIEPGVILDGAHNPDKIKALIDFVGKSFFLRHSRVNENPDPLFREDDINADGVTLVLAFKKGKNWQEMIDLLVKNLPIKEIITTEFQAVTDTGTFAAVPAEEIAKYVSGSKYLVTGIRTIKNSQEATFEAIQVASDQQPASILVTGSLYLVGEVRTLWCLPEF